MHRLLLLVGALRALTSRPGPLGRREPARPLTAILAPVRGALARLGHGIADTASDTADHVLDLIDDAGRYASERVREIGRERRERRMWSEVTSLRGAGHLIALWCEGSMSYTPGYGCTGDPGPDRETERIAHDLGVLNRAGLVTFGSQPGEWLHESDPRVCLHDCRAAAQRAAVDALAHPDLAEHVARIARAAGLLVQIGPMPRHRLPWRNPDTLWVSVFTQDEVPDDVASVEAPPPDALWSACTRFGGADRDDVAESFTGMGESAWEEFETATMLTVVDPEWGRERLLWDTLSAAVRQWEDGVQRVG